MNLLTQVWIIILSISIIIYLFEKIRKQKYSVKFSLPWLFTFLTVIILAFFPTLIDKIARLLGIKEPTNAIFFNGFVSLKDTDPTYGKSVLEEWQRKVLTFKAELQLKFKIQHEVNYRIYSDWESVQDYHMRGISKLKGGLNETN